jgi:hypothetical protein
MGHTNVLASVHAPRSVRACNVAQQRWSAPRASGGQLIEPPLPALAEILHANVQRRQDANCQLQGRRLGKLAAAVRREVLQAAWNYTRRYRDVPRPDAGPAADTTPLLLAGHQPELFHPGVWLKNFVLGRAAAAVQGTAVNLVIDSDTVKTSAIRVPTGSVEQPWIEAVPIDEPMSSIPFECRRIQRPDVLAQCGDRVAQALAPLVRGPMIRRFWPLVVQRSRATDNLGECLAQARHQWEARWGLATLELPQSQICQTEGFAWFAVHLLAHLPRFWEVHNAALLEYRRRYRVRSRTHPVPELAAADTWLEAPFWVYDLNDSHRRRVFVRQRGDETLLTDRHGWQAALPLTPERDAQPAAAALLALHSRGVRFRTRALATTLFARLLAGDVFFHGIGGAKYDELTDQILEQFYGVAPPTYVVVSGTLRLPIEGPAVGVDQLRRVEQQLRRLQWHPERFFEALGGEDGVCRDRAGSADREAALQLAAQKRRWIDTQPTPELARTRCREIRRINEALQSHVACLRDRWQRQAELLAAAVRAQKILGSREYSFCLYPEEILRDFLLEISAEHA